MNENDYCPICGKYIDVDFSHYSESDGRPVYIASCGCDKDIPSKQTSWAAPQGCLGSFVDL